jgi:hypothetical protein
MDGREVGCGTVVWTEVAPEWTNVAACSNLVNVEFVTYPIYLFYLITCFISHPVR